MDKISYALGLSMGQNLMGSGVESLNYQDLAQGIEDVLTKQQPKISYQEAQQVLNTFFQELEQKVAGAAKAEGEKFLAENAKREGVKVTASDCSTRYWSLRWVRNPKQRTPYAYTTRAPLSTEPSSTAATVAASRSLSLSTA